MNFYDQENSPSRNSRKEIFNEYISNKEISHKEISRENSLKEISIENSRKEISRENLPTISRENLETISRENLETIPHEMSDRSPVSKFGPVESNIRLETSNHYSEKEEISPSKRIQMSPNQSKENTEENLKEKSLCTLTSNN